MSARRKREEQQPPASLPDATPREDTSLEDHDEDLELKRKKRKKEMDKAKYQRMLATESSEEKEERKKKDRERKKRETKEKAEEERMKNRKRIQEFRDKRTETEKMNERDDQRYRMAKAKFSNATQGDAIKLDVTFPESTPPAIKRVSEQFLQTILLPWKSCDCCGSLRRTDKLRKPKTEAAIAHHHLDPGRDLAEILLCLKCFSFKPAAGKLSCPYAPHNLFPRLSVPKELQDLTLAEKEVIRRVHPFQALLVLPKGQQGSRGQVIHLPASPVEKLRQLLPADPRDVLLVAQDKPNGQPGTFTKLRVEKVLAALNFLKAKNPRYSKVDIRGEAEIRNLFDSWEQSLQQKEVGQQEGKQTMETGSEDQLPLSESALISMDGSALERRILEHNANSPVDRRGEFVEADAYPHLFPHGFGDYSDKDRPVSMTQREYVQHRLLAHPEFQRDESWAFRALNNLNQQDMAKAIQFIQKTGATKKQAQNSAGVTSGDLLMALQREDEDDDLDGAEILNHHYYVVGSAIRGTSMYFKKARRHLFSMFATLGAPDLFLTLSANDLEWLDLFHIIDPQRFQTQESVTAFDPRRESQLPQQPPSHLRRALFQQGALPDKLPYLACQASRVRCEKFFRSVRDPRKRLAPSSFRSLARRRSKARNRGPVSPVG